MNCPSCKAENPPEASVCARCGAELLQATQVVVTTVSLAPGAVFHNRYEILSALGRGGMGMVYKARDRTLDEVVAIKVLRPDFSEDQKMAERFRSEIKLARRIRHKNVCAIHDYGEDRGLLYISMEYIDGVDLKHVLRDQGPLPPERAYDVAIQVAEGLQAVHEAGIIHRDLKSPNIMIDGTGLARLMDFGIAKRQGAEGTMTATGQIIGTPEYMSPEQAQGQKLDFRSDVYALGIVTWEAFTGHVPFHGDTPLSTILKHLNDPPPLEGPMAASLPSALCPVLRKALAKDPANRYASAADFAEALRNARSPSRRQQPVSTAALQAPTIVRPPARRRPAWLLPAAGLLVAVGAAALFFVLRPGPAPAPPPPVTVPATAPASLAPPTTAVPVPAATAAPTEAPAPVPTAAPATPRPTPRPATPPPATPAPARVSPAAPPPTAAPAPAATATPARPVGSGHLLVVVKPWGEVNVDGKPMGTTPIDKIPLAAGSHVVRVRFPGYEPIERTVTVRPDQVERLVVDVPAEGRKQ